MSFRLVALVTVFVLASAVGCGSDDRPSATESPTAGATKSPPSGPSRSVAATPSPSATVQTWLVIMGGPRVDGTGAEPVADAFVIVGDGRISSVGEGQPVIPPGATVVDAQGGTIMPGLIDTHVHVARGVFSGGVGSIEPGGLMPWLEAGMTTLRDIATPPEAFPEVKLTADGQTAGHEAPRVVWAGPMVTAAGGYPFTVPRYASVGEDVESVEDARQVVARLADGGARIKNWAWKRGITQTWVGPCCPRTPCGRSRRGRTRGDFG